jgi:tetratricopeptide (TPR) repeat protein
LPIPAAPPRFPIRYAGALLVLLALAAYLPALGAGFIWDDDYSILGNPLLTGLDGLVRIWTTVGRIPKESHWWPLTYAVLWAERALWGPRPLGFHLVNLLLHAAVVLLFWRLLRRVRLPGAWIAAALFAVHPAHVESVAWIIEIKDLLSTLCYLLAVGFFLDSIDDPAGPGRPGGARGRPLSVAALAAAAFAGMLCKSAVVTLPAGLAILAWFRRGRLARRELFPIALAAFIVLAMAALDVTVTRSAGTSLPGDAPALAVRLARSGWSFWFYVSKLLWPHGLSCIYPQWRIDAARPADWIPLATAVAATGALWLLRGRFGRGALACWLFYAAALAPMIGVIHFSFMTIAPVADRFQYMASLGPLAGAGALCGVALESGPILRRRIAIAAAIAMILLFAAKTAAYSRLFSDQAALFGNALRYAPESETASTNYAVGLMRAQRWPEARAALEHSVALRPDSLDALCNLGETLTELGEDRRAAGFYRRALALSAGNRPALEGLAWTLATTPDPALRDPAEALSLAREAAAGTGATNPKCQATLAAAQAAAGDFAAARTTIRRAEALASERTMTAYLRTLEAQKALYDAGKTMERGNAR